MFQNKHSASKSHKMNEGADGSTVEDDAVPSSSDNVTERVGEEGHIQERSDELPVSKKDLVKVQFSIFILHGLF